MSALPNIADRHFTPDEYFEFLDTVQERYEFTDGKVRLMASGTHNHNVAKTDTATYLGGYILENSDCEMYDSDQAIYIPDLNSYVLPDLSFICEEAQFEDSSRRRLLNPTLLFEVLSESTEAYDRGDKFRKYRSLASFREYVLINSRSYLVESFFKEDDKLWHIQSCADINGSVCIHTLDVDLPLATIYRRVVFDK